MSLSPGARLGAYEIGQPLGAGGMGEVYLAKDTRLGRDVAIKVLPAEMAADPDRLTRFEREAKAVSALNHPNIVTLHEMGTSDAGPYLVLESVEGSSLRDVIASGPVPLRKLLNLAAQIAAGLAKAHAAGIVHRDLKPDNVMVTTDGFAKILDFGLARLVWPDEGLGDASDTATFVKQTASGVVLGTLGYLSPEQASGKPADTRADQFALGALLYEMATGERPFKRGTVLESLTATVRDEPEPVRSKRTDLPSPVAWVIERCLAKSPDDRYSSTKDLARDLADLRDRLSEISASEKAVASGPPMRRTWIPLPLLALGLAVIVAGLAFLLGRQTVPRIEPPSYRPLTFQRGLITGARFSPDGKTVYYSMMVGSDFSRVFMTRLDGSESKRLDMPPGFLLSVSSRDELAVLLTEGRNFSTSPGTLVRVPSIGGTPRPLAENVLSADWAPNAQDLAAAHVGNRVEFPLGTALDVRSSWVRVSPTGEHLAAVQTATSSVLIVDRQGRTVTTFAERLLYGIAWAPDGKELWFTASESGSGADRALYAFSLDGRRRLVARSPGAMTVFEVGPGGRTALVAMGAGWTSINAFRGGEILESSLDLYGRSQLVGLSADGKWVLISEDREVAPGTYLRSTDGREQVLLAPQRALGLSPDGKLALVVDRDDRARAQLLPTGTGRPRDLPLPEGLVLTGNPARWSDDGYRLYAKFIPPGQGQAGRTRVWMRAGEEPWRAVTPDLPIGSFAVSPDGRVVAAADASGIVMRFPVDGGAPEPIEGERGEPVQWSRDGRYLYLRQRLEVPARVYRRDLATGRIEPWREIRPADPAGVFSVGSPFLSADGQTFVYQYTRGMNELFLAQGLPQR